MRISGQMCNLAEKHDRVGFEPMAAAFDFKTPAVVIVGHWNPAILNDPGWIAKHILDVPDGQQIDLQAVVVGNQVGPIQIAPEKQIWLFETCGMCCTGQRLELYCRDIDNLEQLYQVVSKVAAKLPHTPMLAIGVNFSIKHTGDIAVLTPQFETPEAFDTLGAIRSQERSDSIEIINDDLLEFGQYGRVPTMMNLTRKTDFNAVELGFNYHSQMAESGFVAAWPVGNPIQHWRQHCLRVLNDCYGTTDLGADYF